MNILLLLQRELCVEPSKVLCSGDTRGTSQQEETEIRSLAF